jgi:hypothetical protein
VCGYADVHRIASALGTKCPHFNASNCKYRATSKSCGTARVAMWHDLHVPVSFTLETSLVGSGSVHFGPAELRDIGTATAAAVAECIGE